MSILLELLGKGLKPDLVELVLPTVRHMGRIEAALLEQETIEGESDPATLVRVAIQMAHNGALDQAQALLTKVCVHETSHAEARLAWAAICAWDGSLEQAIQHLRAAYVHHRDDARVHYGLGHCYERMGHAEEAIRYYLEGLQHRPYLRQLRERLAAIYIMQKDHASAAGQIDALIQEHPEDMWLYMAQGQLHLHEDRQREAVRSFERALTIEPDNFELRDDRVESLVEAGRIEEAIEAIREHISQQGEFPDSYVRLGDMYVQLKNDDCAVQNYNKALQLHPGYLEAAVKLGTQHLRMKRYYQAAEKFNKAMEINDQLITAYVGLGVAQCNGGQNTEAEETFGLAAALEPNTNLLFAEMCRLQLKLARAQEAQKEFLAFDDTDTELEENPEDLLEQQLERHKASMAENPNQADLHYRYGVLLRGKGRNAQATEHFRKAADINASYLKAKVKLGLAQREAGYCQDGLVSLKDALTIKDEYVALHYKLGLLYCDKIRFALAMEHFEAEFCTGIEPTDVQANLMLALQNMGLIDRVAATWRAVCELEPSSQMAFQSQRSISPLNPVR